MNEILIMEACVKVMLIGGDHRTSLAYRNFVRVICFNLNLIWPRPDNTWFRFDSKWSCWRYQC